MFKCPNCKEHTISFLSKSLLFNATLFFPRGKTNCKKCNAVLTIPIWTSLFQLALLLVMVFLYRMLFDSFVDYDFNKLHAYIYASIMLFTYIILLVVIVPIKKIENG